MNEDARFRVPRDAILRTTGQLWRIVVAGLILPAPTALLALWLIRRIGPDQSAAESILGTAVLVTVAGIIGLLLWSVRCPKCGVRWVGRVFGEPDSSAAITRFLSMQQCPACGFAKTDRTGERYGAGQQRDAAD